MLTPELELRGDLRLEGWIVSLDGRGAPTGTRPASPAISGYDYKEFSFGASAGRRLDAYGGALDLTAGPRIGVVTEEGDVPADGTGGTFTDLWLQAAARFVLPIGSRWHPSAALEVAFAPRRVASAAHVDPALPALPTWSAGLALGIAGDAP